MKRLIAIFGMIFVLIGLMAAGSVHANAVIDFGNSGTGGVVTLLAGGQMTGVNIPITVLTVTGAPEGNGTYFVTGGLLNFSTVANTITISGTIGNMFGTVNGIPFQNIGPGSATGVTSPVLLSGTFSSFEADHNGLHDAAGADVKYSGLLLALGLAENTPFSYFGFSLSAQGLVIDQPGTAISTDIKNTAVPEPYTILLLGSGLMGVVGFRRKFSKK